MQFPLLGKKLYFFFTKKWGLRAYSSNEIIFNIVTVAMTRAIFIFILQGFLDNILTERQKRAVDNFLWYHL